MQDKTILFVILGIGIFLSLIYMGVSWICRKTHPQFLNVAMLFGSSLGLVSGTKLCCLVVMDETKLLVGADDKIAIFVGGLAIIWISVMSIADGFRDRNLKK